VNRNQTIWASLDEIRIGERTVSRLSASTVELYRRWLEQGREAPPVRLARQGDAFVVRDGRHRVAAALAAEHTVIEAEVSPIGRIRALIAALIHRGRVAHRSPLDPTWGRALGSASRLHRAGRGFDSHRLHPGLRSVNGKHAPFVRPRWGFNSSRRLSNARSSVD
jgi:hypothetical protein